MSSKKRVEKNQKEEYAYEKHHFYLDSNAGKQVCAWCGLIALRNKASEWCVEKGCNYRQHPSYQKTMVKLTKQFNF